MPRRIFKPETRPRIPFLGNKKYIYDVEEGAGRENCNNMAQGEGISLCSCYNYDFLGLSSSSFPSLESGNSEEAAATTTRGKLRLKLGDVKVK